MFIKGKKRKRAVTIVLATAILIMSMSSFISADTISEDWSEWSLYNTINLKLPDEWDISESIDTNDELEDNLETEDFFELAVASDIITEDCENPIVFYARYASDSENREHSMDIESKSDVQAAFKAYGAAEVKKFYKDTNESYVSEIKTDKVISGEMYFLKVNVKTDARDEEIYWTCHDNVSMIIKYGKKASLITKSEHEMMDAVVSAVDADSFLEELLTGDYDIEYDDFEIDDNDVSLGNLILGLAFLALGLAGLLIVGVPSMLRKNNEDNDKHENDKSSKLFGHDWLIDWPDDEEDKPIKPKNIAESAILEENKQCFAGDDRPAPKVQSFRDSKPEHVKADESKRDSLWTAEKEEYHSIAGDYEENLKNLVRSGMLTKQQMEEMLEKRRRKGGR